MNRQRKIRNRAKRPNKKQIEKAISDREKITDGHEIVRKIKNG